MDLNFPEIRFQELPDPTQNPSQPEFYNTKGGTCSLPGRARPLPMAARRGNILTMQGLNRQLSTLLLTMQVRDRQLLALYRQLLAY